MEFVACNLIEPVIGKKEGILCVVQQVCEQDA
jgi:hypothetical protein